MCRSFGQLYCVQNTLIKDANPKTHTNWPEMMMLGNNDRFKSVSLWAKSLLTVFAQEFLKPPKIAKSVKFACCFLLSRNSVAWWYTHQQEKLDC